MNRLHYDGGNPLMHLIEDDLIVFYMSVTKLCIGLGIAVCHISAFNTISYARLSSVFLAEAGENHIPSWPQPGFIIGQMPEVRP